MEIFEFIQMFGTSNRKIAFVSICNMQNYRSRKQNKQVFLSRKFHLLFILIFSKLLQVISTVRAVHT